MPRKRHPTPRPSGPIDLHDWQRTLSCYVVDPRGTRSIHGLDVDSDLAAHYGFVEVAYLALTGELPGEADTRALEAALVLLSPVGGHEAPGRAASLAGLASSDPTSALAVGWLTLTERNRERLESEAEFLAWLDAGGEGEAPPSESTEASCPSTLARWSASCTGLRPSMSRTRAAICLLHASGLKESEHLLFFMTLAGISAVYAESLASLRHGFMGQPGDLPTTVLVESSDDR